jgi:hypothetical protein
MGNVPEISKGSAVGRFADIGFAKPTEWRFRDAKNFARTRRPPVLA